MFKVFSKSLLFLFLIIFSSFVFAVPAGYSVNFNADYVNDANKNSISFTMSYPDYNAEIDTDTNYLAIVTDSNSSTVTNSGVMDDITKRLDNIQLGELLDGNLTLTLMLYNLDGNGIDVNDVILKDTNLPTPELTAEAYETNPTNGQTIDMIVTFDENVTGFDISDITLTNAEILDFEVDEDYTVYSFDINAIADGEVTVDINAGVATDAAGNSNEAAATFSITYDITAPVPELTAEQTDPTNEQTIEMTVTFDENVTGFDISDITLTNAEILDFEVDVNYTVYSFDINAIAEGEVAVDINAGVATDDANNSNEAATFSIEYDSTAPTGYTVAFDQNYINYSNTSAISFTFTNAELDADFFYVISDNAGHDVNGSGVIQNSNGIVDEHQNLSGLNDGNVTLTVTLTDDANNTGAEATDIILKDTNFPIVDFSDPYYTNETINIAPVITETGSGIASYSWSADANVTIATPDLNATDINASSEGAHTITLEVTDVAGNVQSTEFSFVWDTTGPEIEDINNIFTNETVTVEAIATDSGSGIASYLWSTTPDENVTIATSDANTTDINASVDGNYTIILTVIDNIGNSADTNFLFTWDTMTPALTEISLDDRFNLYLIFSENITWDNNKMDTLSKIEINGANPSAASDPDLNPSTVLLLSFDDYLITDINTFTIDANAFTDLSGNLLPDINADYLDENTTISDYAFPFSYVDTNINDENQLRIHITESLYLEDGNQLQDGNDLTSYYSTYDVNLDNFSAIYNDDENGYYIDFVTTDSNDGATIIIDDENNPLFDGSAYENPYTPIHLQLDNGNWLFRRIVSAGDTVIDFEPDDSSYSIIIPSNINSEQQIDLNLSGILSDDNSLVVPNGEDFFLERQTAGPKYSVTIPAGTTITGANGWDGLITLPIITSNLTVPSATTNITINVGSSYGLTFDKAVKILIGGMAGKRAAYKNGSTVTTISACTAGQIANPDSLTANTGNCYTDNGTDLIIWTMHFTEFAAYTPTEEEDDDDTPGGGSDDDEEEDEDEASCSDIDITTTSITVYSDSTSTKSIAITNDSEDYDFEIDDITITEATGLAVSIVEEPEDIASEDSEYLKIKLEADEFNSATTKTLELELEGVFDDDDETDCSIDEDITIRIQLVSEEETEDADTDTNATTDLNASTRSVIDGANGADANAITYSENNLVSTTKEKKSNDWLFWLLDLSIVVVIIALVLIIKKKKGPRRSRL